MIVISYVIMIARGLLRVGTARCSGFCDPFKLSWLGLCRLFAATARSTTASSAIAGVYHPRAATAPRASLCLVRSVTRVSAGSGGF